MINYILRGAAPFFFVLSLFFRFSFVTGGIFFLSSMMVMGRVSRFNSFGKWDGGSGLVCFLGF